MKLCVMVLISVNEQGQKKLLVISDGVRESIESWRELLLNLKERSFNAPKVALGDGAVGLWAALDKVYPQTRQQRFWVHRSANMLNSLPKSAQPNAKNDLHQIWMVATRDQAQCELDRFIRTYEDKYPKAVCCLVKGREELLTFYDFPAAHWKSLRTINPIESTFATIRHRTKRSKGCLSRNSMLCMIFQLGLYAEENWRRMRGFNHLAEVIKGAKLTDGEPKNNFQMRLKIRPTHYF